MFGPALRLHGARPYFGNFETGVNELIVREYFVRLPVAADF